MFFDADFDGRFQVIQKKKTSVFSQSNSYVVE